MLLDGVLVDTVDNYAASATYGVTHTYLVASSGIHTIALQVTGTKNASATNTYIALDAFSVGDIATPSATPTASAYLNLSRTRSDSTAPVIATSPDGQQVAVAWIDTVQGNADIWLTRSSDGGASWSVPLNLSKTPGRSNQPAVAIENDATVHLVWKDGTYANDRVLYCRYSSGANCERVYWLSNNAADAKSPQVLANASNVYLVWVDNASGTNQVYYRSSNNDGLNWTNAVNVANDRGDAQQPAFALGGSGIIHIVWADSATPGVVTVTPTPSPTPTLGPSPTPGDVTYTYQLYYRRLDTSTETWSPYEVVDATQSPAYRPSLVVDSSGVAHAVYDRGGSAPEVRYKKLVLSGANGRAGNPKQWDTSSQNLSATLGNSAHGKVELYGDTGNAAY